MDKSPISLTVEVRQGKGQGLCISSGANHDVLRAMSEADRLNLRHELKKVIDDWLDYQTLMR